MADEVEPWPVSRADGDKIISFTLDGLEVAVSMLPFVGGAVSGVAGKVRGHRAQARTERLIQDLHDEFQAAVRHLALSDDRRELSTTDVSAIIEAGQERFIPLAHRVMAESLETSNAEKLQRMRRGLASLIGYTITEERDLFVRLLSRYETLHVHIMQVLHLESGGTPRMILRAPEVVWGTISAEYRESYYPGQITSMTTVLEADGLLTRAVDAALYPTAGKPGLMDVNPDPSVGLTITDRGMRFLAFIDEGDARHETTACE